MASEQPVEHVTSTQRYVLDNAWLEARERLRLLEATYDPGTLRHLEALGVAPGWRCLEVGGGGGSIAAWLCQRVGPTGHVVATDIDPRFLHALDAPNLEVRQHNLARDPLEAGEYDLVHARLVLMHVPERQAGLDRMVAALKPGGWLLVEEPDHLTERVPDPQTDAATATLLERCRHARDLGMAAAGVDSVYGRRLYGDVLRRGLVDVGAEGRVTMVRGGSVEAKLRQLTEEQLRPRRLAAGQLSEADMDRMHALLEDPTLVYMSAITMAVWGRKPGG